MPSLNLLNADQRIFVYANGVNAGVEFIYRPPVPGAIDPRGQLEYNQLLGDIVEDVIELFERENG